MDSIIVTAYASPEGREGLNWRLSRSRSESISRYLDEQIKVLQDSLDRNRSIHYDQAGRRVRYERVRIPFISRYKGENWDRLDILVDEDSYLTEGDKSRYELLHRVPNLDAREALLGRERFYNYLKDQVYPKLRTVAFDFHLHRRDMVKDTIHTTVLDSTYMRGVKYLLNMDYEGALALLQPYGDFNTAIAYMGLDDHTIDPSTLKVTEDGYTVSFRDGKTIYIHFGKDGVDGRTLIPIGVRKDSDGLYYWTVDGKDMKDADGNLMRAGATDGVDGIVPQTKVEDGVWKISFDKGKTYTDIATSKELDGVGVYLRRPDPHHSQPAAAQEDSFSPGSPQGQLCRE